MPPPPPPPSRGSTPGPAGRTPPATPRPRPSGTAACRAPVITRCPGSSATPCSPSTFASHATTASGSPSAAAPAPVSTSSPPRVSVIPIRRVSRPSSGTTRDDTATAPLEARSATVSASLIRQSAMRESTISIDGRHPRDGPRRVRRADARAEQPLAHHEHDLRLDLRRDEAVERHGVAVAVDRRGEHRTVVGRVDPDHPLHRRRREPDLAPDDAVAVREQQVGQLALDRVALGHPQRRVGVGERARSGRGCAAPRRARGPCPGRRARRGRTRSCGLLAGRGGRAQDAERASPTPAASAARQLVATKGSGRGRGPSGRRTPRRPAPCRGTRRPVHASHGSTDRRGRSRLRSGRRGGRDEVQPEPAQQDAHDDVLGVVELGVARPRGLRRCWRAVAGTRASAASAPPSSPR